MERSMKSKEKRAPSGKAAFFVLLVVGFFCFSFVVSILINSLRQHEERGEKERSAIKIEVLNGCGVNRLARKVTEILREKGFDVVSFANAESSDLEKTVLIERRNPDRVNAETVGRVIGCSNVTCDIVRSRHLEVSLVLGKDYKKFFGKYLQDNEL